MFTTYCLTYAPECRVIAIEPEPNNIELLDSNIARTDPSRVEVHKVAISDYDGYSTIEDGAGSSVLGTAGAKVLVTTIDSVLVNVEGDIDIFKADIEGSEVDVIMNMSLELQARIKFFAIEYDHDSEGFGAVVEKLSETHQVRTLGAASRGAMIYAERY